MILYKIQVIMLITATIGLGYMVWHTIASCDGMLIKMFITLFYLLICLVGRVAAKQLKREALDKQ